MEDPDRVAVTQVFRDVLVRELDEEQRELFEKVIQFDCGCALLRFFYERPRDWLMLEDIAFHLNAQVSCVESTLDALVQLGFTERREVAGLCFYSFAADARRRHVDELCHWQGEWQATLGRLQTLLGRPAPHESAGKR